MSALLQVGWTWYSSVLIGFGLWTLLYWRANRDRQTPFSQQFAFHSGTLIGLLALVSPLDKLGDEYLFSAHMIQHLLLLFITPTLWLAGTPGWLIDRVVPKRADRLAQWLANPITAFAVFVGVMWIWHLPFFYDWAQDSEAIHIIEHLTFIGAGLVGWWPVVGAETSRIPKSGPPVRILYLFLLTIPCSALAAILTFANVPLYLFYVTAPHPFGLDALADQHLGGLLMWIPTDIHLLLLIAATFLKWFADSERAARMSYFEAESEKLPTNHIQGLGV